MSLLIGIDYGTNHDIPMYTAALKQNGKLHIIDTGKIEDFDYQKFVASEHQIKFVGEPGDLERFKAYIFKGEIEC
jgi:hypothetical protein